jgi:hypothetical protein
MFFLARNSCTKHSEQVEITPVKKKTDMGSEIAEQSQTSPARRLVGTGHLLM